MSLFKVFDVAGSGMNAQSLRLNVTASNLANAESASGSEEGAYRAKHPVFAATLNAMQNQGLSNQASAGVKVTDIIESDAPLRQIYSPENPMANEEGYIFLPNVNAIEEMANMMSASRSYQSNVEVMNTTKQLLLRTIQMGQ
jgi:flagellar basal-body rod protein FlgC